MGHTVNHKRIKPKSKQRGSITTKVAALVDARADGRCEWCGWQAGNFDPTGRKWGLQRAHLTRRWNIEGRTTECDVAALCGPSVNTGTCHWKVDFTAEGREWAKSYSERLYAMKNEN